VALFERSKMSERRRLTRSAGAPNRPAVMEQRGHRKYFLLAALLVAIAAGAVGWTIWQLRKDAVRTAVAETGNIASILSGQLARSLDAIDAVLLDLKRSVEQLDVDEAHELRSRIDTQSFHEALIRRRDRLPWIFSIAIADHNGTVIVSTVGWPTARIDINDRDYFREPRDQVVDYLHVSVPIQNRVDGRQTIVFSRRLADGERFLGVVYVGVNSTYLESIYESIQTINSLLFTLVRRDGTILFRHPHEPGAAGRKLSAEAAWLQSLAKGSSGFRVQALNDGNVRFVSSRAVPQYPLFVNMSVTEDSVLASWRKRASAIGIGSAILLLSSLGLLIAFGRQMRRLNNSEARLAHMAHYDSLTGLANRTLLEREVGAAVQRMNEHGQRFALLMLDLDQFKAVNDVFGHATGDALLKAVGGRLQNVVGSAGLAARLGGDEFAVLQPLRIDESEAADLARKLVKAIIRPYGLDGRELSIGTSIGIAVAPNDGADAETLQRNADAALYSGKAAGGYRFQFYDPVMDARAHAAKEHSAEPAPAHAA
jgi:diguanylate cyclase (GGDEF)-like protein